MEISKGLIVKSIAGKDVGKFFVVFDYDDKEVVISDGKKRPIEHMKKKNKKHISLTTKRLNERSMETNREIRKALNELIRA